MARFDAIFFDLDGTLIDTAPDFVRVVNLLLAEENKPPLPASLIRAQVSNGARALITLAFGINEGEPDFADKLERLLTLYADNLAVATTVFKGLEPLLDRLEKHRIPWGIVTNKPRRYTLPLLDQLNLSQRCASIVCPDDVTHKKPHPESIFVACRKANALPERTLYVGDHIRDIEAGNSAQNTTIAVSWGYADETEDLESWNANHIVHTPDQLLALLNNTFDLND